MEVDLNHVPKLCCELASMHYQLEQINPKIERKGVMAVIVPLMLAGFCCLFMLGCGTTETVSPEITERAAELSSGSAYEKAIDAHATRLATALAAQKLTSEMTLENTQAIMAKLNTLEASLVVPKAEPGKEVIKSAPESPAKANTAATPVKVATPGAFHTTSDGTVLRWNIEGNWNPTILETSAHLREHGIDTNGMTHQEMADLHADLHEGKTGGKPLTGAMFQGNGASAVASKQNAVRFIPRGSGFVQWSNYSAQQSCPSGRCPQRRSR